MLPIVIAINTYSIVDHLFLLFNSEIDHMDGMGKGNYH